MMVPSIFHRLEDPAEDFVKKEGFQGPDQVIEAAWLFVCELVIFLMLNDHAANDLQVDFDVGSKIMSCKLMADIMEEFEKKYDSVIQWISYFQHWGCFCPLKFLSFGQLV